VTLFGLVASVPTFSAKTTPHVWCGVMSSMTSSGPSCCKNTSSGRVRTGVSTTRSRATSEQLPTTIIKSVSTRCQVPCSQQPSSTPTTPPETASTPGSSPSCSSGPAATPGAKRRKTNILPKPCFKCTTTCRLRWDAPWPPKTTGTWLISTWRDPDVNSSTKRLAKHSEQLVCLKHALPLYLKVQHYLNPLLMSVCTSPFESIRVVWAETNKYLTTYFLLKETSSFSLCVLNLKSIIK